MRPSSRFRERYAINLCQCFWVSILFKGVKGCVQDKSIVEPFFRLPVPLRALDFMTDDHHRIRDFVVMELPRVGQPLSLEFIAQALDIPLARVTDILGDLERHMTFLFCNEQGAVVWAYPVTAQATPHHVTFSSGEQIYAA
jgi:hypothetical protein